MTRSLCERGWIFCLALALTVGAVDASAHAQPGPPAGPAASTSVPKKKKSTAPKSKKELITEVQEKQLAKELKAADSNRLLQKGVNNAATRAVAKKWARLSVHSMTLNKNQSNLQKMRAEILRVIKNSGRPQFRDNPVAARRFREILCKEVVDRAVELLDNNVNLQIHAVLIMSQINVVELNKKILPTAYLPAADVLLEKVINAPKPDAVKIVAINGLQRLALLGKPNQAKKRKMANALIPLLENPKTHFWLQSRTARTLGAIGEMTDLGGKAFILEVLTRTMVDKNRTPPVRCACAKALGRADIVANASHALIAFAIADLTKEMAQLYNADFQKMQKGQLQQMPSYWPRCFWHLFLAFQPESEMETRLYGNRKPGLMRRYGNDAKVKEPYKQIKPLIRGVLQQKLPGNPNKKGPAAVFRPVSTVAMEQWLKANSPSVKSIQPGLKPLYGAAAKAAATPKPGSTTDTSAP